MAEFVTWRLKTYSYLKDDQNECKRKQKAQKSVS